MNPTDNPLVGLPPAGVSLPRAPLVRVIAQVRFGGVLSIADMVAGFQEEIRAEYPVLKSETVERRVRVGDAEETCTDRIWRFLDQGAGWRVSLSTGLLAIETREYASRSGFLARFRASLEALERHVRPGVVQRLGVRFIDRVAGDDLQRLDAMVRDDVRGVERSLLRDQVRMSMTHSQFDLPEEKARMMARWGLLPANATVDPAAIEPMDEPSWILDLDAFSAEVSSFDVEALETKTAALAARAYSVFRWAVTDDFLSHYGGDEERRGQVGRYDQDGPSPKRSARGRDTGLMTCGMPTWPGTSGSAESLESEDGFVFETPADDGLLDVPASSSEASPDVPPQNSPEVAVDVDPERKEPPVDRRPPNVKAISELRFTAGLTFDQTARLLGVSRRTIHLWVGNRPMNAANEERLMRTLEIIRRADRGDTPRTRSALLEAAPDGRVPFDLIAEGRLDEARALLGEGPGRAKRAPLGDLSPEEREKRRPIPPWILMDARHDVVHRDIGRGRSAKAFRSKRRGPK